MARKKSPKKTKGTVRLLSINSLEDALKYAQDIIDTVREPFLVLDDKFRVVTANPSFYKAFEVSQKKTEGVSIYKLGNGQWNIPKLKTLLENVLPKKREFKGLEVEHDFPSIGKRVMLLNARQINHAQLILLAVEDVTKEKRHEAQRESSENRFRSLIEKSADAIALVNAKGRVSYASPSTESIIGYTQQEFKKLSNPFKLVPKDERKIITKIFEDLLKRPGTHAHAVYRIKHKKGYLIWIESIMTNLISDPDVGAVIINYRDVSKRKELESQKDDFIGIASHELRTPVTSLKAYTQILQGQFKKYGDATANQNLVKMDAQLNKLNALIGNLLDVTKIERGKIVFNKERFDFNDLIRNTINETQFTTSKHKIYLRGVVKKRVFGDRERIGLVLANLLTNAIKYSPQAERIIVRVSAKGEMATVEVQDFGIGIPNENLIKVFDRFFRVQGDKADTYPGLGLGLYISAEIVRRHGGKMRVKSHLGQGSKFRFSIPFKGKREARAFKPENAKNQA